LSLDLKLSFSQFNFKMTSLSDKRIYKFDEFCLDAEHSMLYRNGLEVHLPPKAVKTLLVLIERSGEIVSKDELMELIWSDSIVEESNLAQYLHLLRKSLGNQPDGKPFIETLRQRGYRFTADVSLLLQKKSEIPLATEDRFAERETLTNQSSANRPAADSDSSVFKAESPKSFLEVVNAEDSSLLVSTDYEYSELVGRETEIEEILGLLKRDGVRLVTLTGVGGVGKTTLAKVAAGYCQTNFPDGILFVDLAAITNHEIVAATIASQLGVKEITGKSIFELLKDFLRERKMLLVLDNFEQVISAAMQIAELLSAADKLKILITSRVSLHLTAEREFIVAPLIVPSEEFLTNYPSTLSDGSDLLVELLARKLRMRISL
jgi:DNA-binding winged helix-turn-helix (wHTH) protein